MPILRGVAERITTAVSLMVVLVCAVVIFRARTPVSLASIAESSVLADSGRYTALIVFQEKDCESNLRLLSLFERPRLRPHFRERGLLLASGYLPDDRLVETVRTALPNFGFRRGTPREWRTLERMGVVQTPYLIVLDGTGQVVYSAAAPTGPAEYVELTRGLTVLADAAAAGASPLPLPVP